MRELLPAELHPRIGEFTMAQLVGLRFASDEELPDLARQVLDEKITDREAIKKKIKYQRSIMSRGGTDSGTIQRSRAGVRTFTLSCPTRYVHTVTESIHLDDLYACRDLLAAYLIQAK